MISFPVLRAPIKMFWVLFAACSVFFHFQLVYTSVSLLVFPVLCFHRMCWKVLTVLLRIATFLYWIWSYVFVLVLQCRFVFFKLDSLPCLVWTCFTLFFTEWCNSFASCCLDILIFNAASMSLDILSTMAFVCVCRSSRPAHIEASLVCLSSCWCCWTPSTARADYCCM